MASKHTPPAQGPQVTEHPQGAELEPPGATRSTLRSILAVLGDATAMGCGAGGDMAHWAQVSRRLQEQHSANCGN